MTRRRWLAVMVVVLILIVAVAKVTSGSPSPGPVATDPSTFVTSRGTDFFVGNQPFEFVGFNLYDAASAGEDFYHCTTDAWPHYTGAQLSSALKYMHDEAGATVVRFWAYQTYTRSGLDWAGIDTVIADARRYGMRVLPVLEDGPGYCTNGPAGVAKYKYQGDTWYSQGYQTPYDGAPLSYLAYVKKIVSHYAGNPTILGWEMMNEATTSQRVGYDSAIVGFARTVGTLIHAVDPHHLVTVGTESDGWPGASGPDFATVYSLPEIDFATAHDYGSPSQHSADDPTPLNGLSTTGSLPAPGSAECRPTYGAPLACSVAIDVQVVRKPMVIDEVGVPADPSAGGSLRARADLFDRKFAAMFGHGVRGVLVWDFNKVPDVGGGSYGVQQTTDDPLFGVMRQWAVRVGRAR